MSSCKVSGCCTEAKKFGLCWAHYKRKQQGTDLARPLVTRAGTRWRRLTNAALRFAARHRSKGAEEAFRAAVIRYIKSRWGQ